MQALPQAEGKEFQANELIFMRWFCSRFMEADIKLTGGTSQILCINGFQEMLNNNKIWPSIIF